MLEGLGDGGFCLGLASVGSGLGACVAGMAAIGGWKKCYIQNKAAPFILMAFVGAPLSQTIYGFILGNAIRSANFPDGNGLYQMLLGIAYGLGIGVSAWMQGKVGASGADAMAETGKGFGNYIMVVGILETVALFVLVLAMSALPK